MRINRLKLRNYRKFREAEMEFGDGIISINGVNGAGKSTIVEAMSWALYGNSTKILRDSKSGVKSSAASGSDRCSVEVEFEIAGENYYLVREMRGKAGTIVAEIKQNGICQASTDADVRNFVERLLGMDAEGFVISVFARQKELNAFSQLSREDRKRKIEKMLGLDAIDRARRLISEDKRRIKSETDGMRSILYDAEGKALLDGKTEELALRRNKLAALEEESEKLKREEESLAAALKSAKKALDALTEKEKRHIEIRGKIRKSQERIEEKLEEMRRYGDELAALKEKESLLKGMKDPSELLNEKEEDFRAFEERKEKKRKYEDLVERKRALEDEILSTKQKLNEYERDMEEMRSRMPNADAMKEKQTEVRSEIERLQGEDMELGGRIKSLQGEIYKIERNVRQIESLGPESECPTCHRKLGEDYSAILEQLNQEVSVLKDRISGMAERKGELKSRIRALKKQLEGLDKDIKEAGRALISLSKMESKVAERKSSLSVREKDLDDIKEKILALGSIDFDENEYRRLRGEISELRRKEREYIETTTEVKRIPSIKDTIERLREDIEESRERLSELTESLKSLEFSETELKEAKEEYEKLLGRERRTHGDVERYMANIESEKDAIRSLEGEISEIERNMKALEELEDKFRYLSELESLMKEFRSHSIQSIRPSLERIASDFFATMTAGKYPGIEMDEDYKIRIIDLGRSYPIERFSGGESDLANLCLRLAISDVVVRARGAKGFNFLVLDEIFGSQDIGRRENILKALQSLQNRFSQIFLISHIEGIKESANMVINVEEGPDGSSRVHIT